MKIIPRIEETDESGMHYSDHLKGLGSGGEGTAGSRLRRGAWCSQPLGCYLMALVLEQREAGSGLAGGSAWDSVPRASSDRSE